jgi:hypothetical protein
MEDKLQPGETYESLNINFDTVWQSKGSRTVDGFDVEVVVPFRSLRFKPPAPGEEVVFGIGFKRNIPRKNEEVLWPFVPNDSTWYRPAELGHLRGMRNIQPGRSVEIRPYTLGSLTQNRQERSTEQRVDVGLDAKWGVTSGLTADFTVNTDFAQEEADIQQINFTRFSLFFPEKRQFFLEGERMFQFGVPREADLVFTRRIGLSAGGEVVPILGGARLSGRQGRMSIGAMSLQTDELGDLPSENFAVIRLRRDVFTRSSIGALFTSRQGGGYFNRVYGADANLFFRQVWSAEAFVARMDDSGDTQGAHAAYGRFSYDADRQGLNYEYLDLGERFRPGVGFVRRPNSRQHTGSLRYSPRPDLSWIRQFHFVGSLYYVTDQRNVLESRERSLRAQANLESGDIISLEYANRLESINAPFRLRPTIIIPPGTYRFDSVQIRLSSYRRRPATINLQFSTGGFWDGQRDTLSLEARYRPSKHLELSGSYEKNWVSLPQGKLRTDLISTRILLAFRNDLALLSLFQYNEDTGELSTNIRFNWIPRPGSDFFIVYNELDDWLNGLQGRNRSLVVKLNYLFTL